MKGIHPLIQKIILGEVEKKQEPRTQSDEWYFLKLDPSHNPPKYYLNDTDIILPTLPIFQMGSGRASNRVPFIYHPEFAGLSSMMVKKELWDKFQMEQLPPEDFLFWAQHEIFKFIVDPFWELQLPAPEIEKRIAYIRNRQSLMESFPFFEQTRQIYHSQKNEEGFSLLKNAWDEWEQLEKGGYEEIHYTDEKALGYYALYASLCGLYRGKITFELNNLDFLFENDRPKWSTEKNCVLWDMWEKIFEKGYVILPESEIRKYRKYFPHLRPRTKENYHAIQIPIGGKVPFTHITLGEKIWPTSPVVILSLGDFEINRVPDELLFSAVRMPNKIFTPAPLSLGSHTKACMLKNYFSPGPFVMSLECYQKSAQYFSHNVWENNINLDMNGFEVMIYPKKIGEFLTPPDIKMNFEIFEKTLPADYKSLMPIHESLLYISK